MICLDFGSGYNPKDGYLTCDRTSSPKLDFVFDPDAYKIIDVDDNHFDVIRCRNVIHHVHDLRKLFLEFQRTLKVNGKLIIIEPTRKSYKSNLILDILWYRFVIPRYEVWFSPKYREYVDTLKQLKFKEESHTEGEKEYYTFRRI